MPKLLCVTPQPGLKTHYGRIPANLIPYWNKYFDEIGLWSTYGDPAQSTDDLGIAKSWYSDQPLLERLPELGEVIQQGGWTHIWVLGDLSFLLSLAGLGLTQDRLPDQLLYAYAVIDTPFVDQQFANLAAYYDFFVCLSGMTTGAYTELVAGMGSDVPKELFKSALRCKTIRPGIDNTIFHPLDDYKREFSQAELKTAFFNGKVTEDDFLIMVSGQKSWRKGIPQACSIVNHLKSLMKDRQPKLYIHMPDQNTSLNIPMIAAGCDLSPSDILYGHSLFDDENSPLLDDQKLNLLYNAADLLLCPDLANGWSFTASEAMAAGTVVAAPDDHVWLDLINGRGIELPCTEFGRSPWSTKEFARSIDAGLAAQAIAETVNDVNKFDELRESGIYWAFVNPSSTWKYSAEEWLGLFGML